MDNASLRKELTKRKLLGYRMYKLDNTNYYFSFVGNGVFVVFKELYRGVTISLDIDSYFSYKRDEGLNLAKNNKDNLIFYICDRKGNITRMYCLAFSSINKCEFIDDFIYYYRISPDYTNISVIDTRTDKCISTKIQTGDTLRCVRGTNGELYWNWDEMV